MRRYSFGLVPLAAAFAAHAAGAQATVDSVTALLRTGGPAPALAYARALVQASPKDPWAQHALARAASEADSHDVAIRAAEEAVKLAPNVARHHVVLGQVRFEKAGDQGGLGAMGTARGGKAALERALQLDPANLEAREWLMGFHLDAPGIAGGNKDEAKRFSREIAQRDSVRGFFAMMRVALKIEDDFQVQQLFERGLTWVGTPVDSSRAITGTLVSTAIQVKSDKTKETLTARLYAAKPGEAAFTYARARLWTIQGKELPKAEAIFRDLLSRDPMPPGIGAAGAHWRLGQIYEKTGRQNEALAEYREAVNLNAQLPEARRDMERLEKKLKK
jgi:tetratricopeptide (TPR) repeat protein